MYETITRRNFLAASAAGAMATLTRRARAAEDHPLLANFDAYDDPVTGARVYILATGEARDDVVYQTHPMWTPGMRHLVFKSARENGTLLPHVLTLASGDVRPLVVADSSPAFSLSHDGATMAYIQDRTVYALDVVSAANGDGVPRKVAELAADVAGVSGSISIDATGETLYAGVVLDGEESWAVVICNLKNGTWATPVRVDFQVGHTQCHPANPRYTLFCHETGGFARQRMWLFDAETGKHAPLYESKTKEWVTHEVWWQSELVLFTIWPYDDLRRAQPHGIATYDLAGTKRRILARYPAWHTPGSPDGQWVMGDDFDRNLWLIHVESGERRLLTQGHNSEDFKTHPHASFSPDSRGILFNSSRGGTEDIYYVVLPPWESLKQLPAEE